eukprot:SAG31_NODE_12246_length_956_cov_1.082847_2_plen_167_part_01
MVLDVVDTPGQRRFRALCSGFVAKAHGVVVVVEGTDARLVAAGHGNESLLIAEDTWLQAMEWVQSTAAPKVVVVNWRQRSNVEQNIDVPGRWLGFEQVRDAAEAAGAIMQPLDPSSRLKAYLDLEAGLDVLVTVCLAKSEPEPQVPLQLQGDNVERFDQKAGGIAET